MDLKVGDGVEVRDGLWEGVFGWLSKGDRGRIKALTLSPLGDRAEVETPGGYKATLPVSMLRKIG